MARNVPAMWQFEREMDGQIFTITKSASVIGRSNKTAVGWAHADELLTFTDLTYLSRRFRRPYQSHPRKAVRTPSTNFVM